MKLCHLSNSSVHKLEVIQGAPVTLARLASRSGIYQASLLFAAHLSSSESAVAGAVAAVASADQTCSKGPA